MTGFSFLNRRPLLSEDAYEDVVRALSQGLSSAGYAAGGRSKCGIGACPCMDTGAPLDACAFGVCPRFRCTCNGQDR